MAKTFSYISPPFRLVASAACKKARLYSSMSRKVRKAFRQRTFDPSRRTTTGCSRSERALGTLFDCVAYDTFISFGNGDASTTKTHHTPSPHHCALCLAPEKGLL